MTLADVRLETAEEIARVEGRANQLIRKRIATRNAWIAALLVAVLLAAYPTAKFLTSSGSALKPSATTPVVTRTVRVPAATRPPLLPTVIVGRISTVAYSVDWHPAAYGVLASAEITSAAPLQPWWWLLIPQTFARPAGAMPYLWHGRKLWAVPATARPIRNSKTNATVATSTALCEPLRTGANKWQCAGPVMFDLAKLSAAQEKHLPVPVGLALGSTPGQKFQLSDVAAMNLKAGGTTSVAAGT